MNKLGKIRHDIGVSNEYELLAKNDEEAATLLENVGQYKHAMYFYIQAMEKYIRAKIFSKVNPNLQYFREKNKHHSLDEAINFLLEIISTDENLKEMIRKQLTIAILGDVNFQQLHNNLRYPFYSKKFDSYSILDFSKEDCDFIRNGLNKLKVYLKDIDKVIYN